MNVYRVGSCWGVTIVQSDEKDAPDKDGRRVSDRLIATAQTREDADLIVRALGHWRKFEGES